MRLSAYVKSNVATVSFSFVLPNLINSISIPDLCSELLANASTLATENFCSDFFWTHFDAHCTAIDVVTVKKTKET